MGDVVERMGKTVVSIRSAFAPVVDFFIDLSNRVMDIIDKNQEHIQSVISFVSGNIIKTFQAVGAVTGWVTSMFGAFMNGLRNGNPVFVSLTSAAIGLAAALAAYRAYIMLGTLVTKAWIVITKAVTLATTAWSIAQGGLNAVLSANPVGLGIAAIAGVIAIIAFLVIKVDGWGKMWNHVVNGAKLLWEAFTEGVKWQFNTMIDGLMIGLKHIKKGWYSFKEAVGLGDSSENQKMLAQINADTEARKNAIVGGAQKVVELNRAAINEFKQGWNSLSWNDTSLSDIMASVKNRLGIAAPDIPGTSGGGGGIGGLGGLGGPAHSVGGDKTGGDTANSIATGGTKTTHITINLGELVGSININKNGFRESAENMRDIVLDEMTRALSMAQGQAV